ncbi:MAG: SufD family Fe-S cluster assembly protein [Desulfovibrionaceae bacterium]|nr:SufD family Fe-S cluster assembly protein [Desulfovibrionaceae bacterium]
MSLDLSRYSFTQGEETGQIANLGLLPKMDQVRLLGAGIDVTNNSVSGSFMQINREDVHCDSQRDGLELMSIKAALKKFDGLPNYFWKLLNPDADDILRKAHETLHGGYFVRAKKGVRLHDPLQSCMFMKGARVGQSIHNIVIVEEGAEVHILNGCATQSAHEEALHLGLTEFYVEKGGKLTFTMVHNWGDNVVVRPKTAGIVEEGGEFQSNYILLKTVGDLSMYPTIKLNGAGAVARFNSVIVAPEGSNLDCGNRIELNAQKTRGEVIARVVTTGGKVINRGFIGAYATPVKGHLECKGLLLGGGSVHTIPELYSECDGVELSHEAAVGKIAQEEIEYLMARGLDEDEATSTIVRGFLNVEIMGLPNQLQNAINEQIETLNAGNAL